MQGHLTTPTLKSNFVQVHDRDLGVHTQGLLNTSCHAVNKYITQGRLDNAST